MSFCKTLKNQAQKKYTAMTDESYFLSIHHRIQYSQVESRLLVLSLIEFRSWRRKPTRMDVCLENGNSENVSNRVWSVPNRTLQYISRRLPPAMATSTQLTIRGQLPYLGHSHYKTKTFKHLILFWTCKVNAWIVLVFFMYNTFDSKLYWQAERKRVQMFACPV